MSIENPTLVHFLPSRGSGTAGRHFSSLLTNLPSTTVESALQIRPFMQNKANFRKSQMNVTSLITADYEKKTLGKRGKKQSQTKPNKAKFKKAEMNVTSILTVGYENKPPIRAPKKQSQTSKRQKPMQTSLPKGIMKETRFWVREKQTQFKANKMPKQTQSNPIFGKRFECVSKCLDVY